MDPRPTFYDRRHQVSDAHNMGPLSESHSKRGGPFSQGRALALVSAKNRAV